MCIFINKGQFAQSCMFKRMSRNVDCIFPDVFSYPISKQEIQLSSFYEPARPPVKPTLKESQYSQQSKIPIQDVKTTANVSNVNAYTGSGHGSIQTTGNNLVLPPMRRVVKFPISSIHTTIMVVCFAFTNGILCILTPEHITPALGTLWGRFAQFWLLITLAQMVSHSVYLCTPIATFGSIAHLCIVLTSAIIIPPPLFAHYLWLAPCLCCFITAYQSHILCLVYSNVHNQWIYAVVGSSFVLIPMTQLFLIDPNREDMVFTSFIWSSISICALYGFAFANSKASVLVDVTVGATPTWQLQE